MLFVYIFSYIYIKLYFYCLVSKASLYNKFRWFPNFFHTKSWHVLHSSLNQMMVKHPKIFSKKRYNCNWERNEGWWVKNDNDGYDRSRLSFVNLYSTKMPLLSSIVWLWLSYNFLSLLLNKHNTVSWCTICFKKTAVSWKLKL